VLLGVWLGDAVGADEKIALLGAIQSLFEGSMYTFVFLWTPAWPKRAEHPPTGSSLPSSCSPP